MNLTFSKGGVFILFSFVLLQEEATKPAIKIKGNCADIIESAPQNQTNNNNLTYVDGEYKNNSSGKLVTIYEFFPLLKFWDKQV